MHFQASLSNCMNFSSLFTGLSQVISFCMYFRSLFSTSPHALVLSTLEKACDLIHIHMHICTNGAYQVLKDTEVSVSSEHTRAERPDGREQLRQDTSAIQPETSQLLANVKEEMNERCRLICPSFLCLLRHLQLCCCLQRKQQLI